MSNKIYLIIRNRNNQLLSIANNKKRALELQKEEDEYIAKEYNYDSIKEAKQNFGELTEIERWCFNKEDNRYYQK